VIIGLAGLKRSGKNTAAAHLCQRYRMDERSFAEPMRRFVAGLLDWTLEELEARKEEVVPWLGVTPRHMLQSLGTEWGRKMVHHDLWVRTVMHKIEKHAGVDHVLSDVRFPNEAEAIHQQGGKVVRLVGRGATGDAHESEVPLPAHLVDFELSNAGTLDELYDALDSVVLTLAGA
jgi:hypothetical protein